MNIEVGQMGELTYKNDGENADWEYVVAVKVFDDRVEFVKEFGGRYMCVFNEDDDAENEVLKDQKTKSFLTMLKRDGRPVFSKKNIFGKYTFEV